MRTPRARIKWEDRLLLMQISDADQAVVVLEKGGSEGALAEARTLRDRLIEKFRVQVGWAHDQAVAPAPASPALAYLVANPLVFQIHTTGLRRLLDRD